MPAYNRCQDLPYEGMNALAYFSKISHWHYVASDNPIIFLIH